MIKHRSYSKILKIKEQKIILQEGLDDKMVKIDDKLDNLKQVVLHMATLINNMYGKVYECLETMDVDKALEVIKMDEFVNRCEEEVNDTGISSR